MTLSDWMEQGALAPQAQKTSDFNWSGDHVVNQASEQYRIVRERTEQIVSLLTDEDQQLQSMPEASPTKWHRAHTSWFFETFILQEFHKDYQVFNKSYAFLFNSYYESVGCPFPRQQRGMLSRPSSHEISEYRRYVDQALQEFLLRLEPRSEKKRRILELLELGLHHEQQHQELLVTDLKHAFLQNPLWPSFGIHDSLPVAAPPLIEKTELSFQQYKEGIYTVGNSGASFAFDNEGPQHEVLLPEFEMATQPLNNQAVLDFIEAGGYQTPLLWLSDGWAWCKKEGRAFPSYWRKQACEPFSELTLLGELEVHPQRIASHLTYFEADAIARFLEARLPTEFEWEVAAHSQTLHSIGKVWEWTASSYQPYPGFKAEPGAVGEYNGKFMHGQQVLRGSSIATAPKHNRLSYRNFFPASTYFQFSGARLARNPKQ